MLGSSSLAKPSSVAHVFVPVFRERLSGFYAKAVEVEVVLIFVLARSCSASSLAYRLR